MDEASINEPEGSMLNLLNELGELEWRKFQRRSVSKMVGGSLVSEDCSGHPPFVSFRFKAEHQETIHRLSGVVLGFSGNVRWVMVGHEREGLPGVNWMICPEATWSIRDIALAEGRSPGDYMAEHQPDFAKLAYADLPNLESALRGEFRK